MDRARILAVVAGCTVLVGLFERGVSTSTALPLLIVLAAFAVATATGEGQDIGHFSVRSLLVWMTVIAAILSAVVLRAN